MTRCDAGVIALVLVFACHGELPHPAYVQQPTSALVEVRFPPPPPRVETIPPQPDNRAVWIDGEWAWRGHRWAWRVGRWVIPPEGARFSPWTFVRNESGTLYFASGAWRNARGEDVVEPKALASGGASGGAVVDPEGYPERTGPNVRPEGSSIRHSDPPGTNPALDGGT
jgi:hypothetical protein